MLREEQMRLISDQCVQIMKDNKPDSDAYKEAGRVLVEAWKLGVKETEINVTSRDQEMKIETEKELKTEEFELKRKELDLREKELELKLKQIELDSKTRLLPLASNVGAYGITWCGVRWLMNAENEGRLISRSTSHLFKLLPRLK